MLEEKYRLDRTLTVLTVMMLAMLGFSMLSFFGIINTKTVSKEYCIMPRAFACNNLRITSNAIEFELTNNFPDIYSLKVIPSSLKCMATQYELVESKKTINVKLPCSMIEDESFKTSITLEYSGGRNIGTSKEKGKIKGNVV